MMLAPFEAQPSRLRVRAASRRLKEHEARRPVNSQARTPALRNQAGIEYINMQTSRGHNMRTSIERGVTLFCISLVISALAGCAASHPKESGPVVTDSAEAATIAEINAAAKLSMDNSRTHALVQVAERPKLPEPAQIHLINAAYRNLQMDNNKTVVLAKMIDRADFSDATKQAIVSQLGKLSFDFNRQFILQHINERARRTQAAAAVTTTAAVATNPPAPPRPNPAIIPVSRTGNATNRQFLVLQRAKDNPGACDIVFIGDSITQGWEGSGRSVWTNYYSGRKCLNFGVGGDRTEHVLWRFEQGQLDGLKPKAAVLMIGTNNSNKNRDGTEQYSEAEILEGIQAIIKQIRTRLPDTKLLVLGIFPRSQTFSTQRGKLLQINQALARAADGQMIHYIDFGSQLVQPDGSISRDLMPDYLHLSEKGYEIWAKAIEPKLKELLAH
jgi:lysophospholipase L1-like esterase